MTGNLSALLCFSKCSKLAVEGARAEETQDLDEVSLLNHDSGRGLTPVPLVGRLTLHKYRVASSAWFK